MSTQLPFLCNGDDSFAVISACYTLTEQYRNILIDLGKEHQLSENEMLVLVHLAQYPEACTQKKTPGNTLAVVCFLHLPYGRFPEKKELPYYVFG